MTDANLDELRAAADAAWATIDHDPDRVGELSDDDLAAISANVETATPLCEAALVASLGDSVDAANACITRVLRLPQARLIKLVRRATASLKATGNATPRQLAALVVDFKVGVGRTRVERERRRATIN